MDSGLLERPLTPSALLDRPLSLLLLSLVHTIMYEFYSTCSSVSSPDSLFFNVAMLKKIGESGDEARVHVYITQGLIQEVKWWLATPTKTSPY